jgi:assimilatory nitrate reductase catalytic subunit
VQKIITLQSFQREPSSVKTHCPYCAFQCGMSISGPHHDAQIAANEQFPVNKGRLCAKGWNAASTLAHPDRLLTPLIRNEQGLLEPASWESALSLVAQSFKRVQECYGKDAIGLFGGGSLTNEKAYLLGKFARVALGTAQIDYNGRFCMSSAAAASKKAFGLDRGLPFPLEDIPLADVILLIGSNIAETMPPLMQYFLQQRARGGTLIVVDPRATATATQSTLHLRLTPGSDAALANGILHILVRDGLIDQRYIDERTEGFAQVKARVATYWPERVERITGVSEKQLTQVAQALGRARSAMILTARGAEQQSQGVNNTLAYINIALALGLVGRLYSGYGCLTGQGNGQGGREHGQKADQLPGYRLINDPVARKHIAAVWGIDEQDIPHAGCSAYEMLDTLGTERGIRALFVVGSNVVVSAPRALHVTERLKALDFLVVSDFFLSETAQLANVVLPSAQWVEEEGTMTNLEGRVIKRERVFAPPAGVRTDNDIVCELACLLGKGAFFSFTEPRQIFDELRRASAGGQADYAGITYEKIEAQQGVFWPCPSEDHPGTRRLFQDTFPTPTGRAQFHAVTYRAPAEEPDDAYPFYLTTGRVLAQYQSGTQTRRTAQLCEIAPTPFVEIHPLAARSLGLADGDLCELTTRRGSALFTVKITSTIRDDTVFVPFHWGGMQSVNRLTNPALDPVSRMPEFKVCAVNIKRVSAIREE